jgi:hypothetical protein
MDQIQSQSVRTIAAAMMRVVWCGLLSRFGFSAGEADFDVVIHHWVTGIFRRFDELLAQYRAGKKLPETAPRAAADKRPYASEPQHVLSMPEMAEWVDTSVQAKRIQRPVLHKHAVEMLQTARVCQPRLTPEPYMLALPRRAFIWAWWLPIFEEWVLTQRVPTP